MNKMHRKFVYRSLALLCLYCQLFTAVAYEPDHVHEPLTALALEIDQYCFPASPVFADLEQEIVDGNRFMDEGIYFRYPFLLNHRAPFKLRTRVNNWHFYHPDRLHLSRVGDLDQSMMRLWSMLREGFDSETKPSYRALFLGGLLHLLEDVSVPAHVVPVFHGPTLAKRLDKQQIGPLIEYMEEAGHVDSVAVFFGAIKDTVDSVPADIATLRKKMLKRESCDLVVESQAEPEQLLEDLARQVYRQIDETVPGCSDLRWHSFWVPPEEGTFFGRYNLKDGHPLFNQAGRLPGSEERCTFDADDERYHHFAARLHEKALLADLKLLYWARKQWPSKP